MSRIVATRDSFSVELQDTSAMLSYWFEIPVGGLDSRPGIRGTNTIVPSRAGQTWRPKRTHSFPLTLHGFVGETESATYVELMDDLHDVFELGEEVTIALYPDATGVGGRVPEGSVATRVVEAIAFTGLPAVIDQVRIFDIECIGITSPMAWALTEGS